MYSSSVLCYRSKGPISFSFSDHSYFLSSRFDKYPFAPSSCCCTCSCCCASSTCCGGHSGYQVHISAYLSLGLRKSALLQWAASRRVVLGGADQYYCRFPLYGIYRDVYEGNSCDFVESSRDGRNGGRRKKIRCLGSEKSDEIKRRMSRFEDAEAVLSLLSEEVDRKCFDLRERKRSSSKRYGAEKEKTCVNDNYRVKKKNVGLVSSESNSKCKLESVEIKCRNEVHGQKEGREMFRREGNLRTKKGGSSCSSYHSLLSSGDFESDLEDTKAEGFVEESSAGFYNDTLRDESKINTKMLEAHNQLNEAREGNESMERRNSVSRSNMEWDWRKKSEKKLTDLSYTEAQLKKESFEGYSTMSRTDEYDNRRSFNSQGQFIDKEKISADLESKELVHLGRNNTEALSISELEKKSEKTKVCMACGSDVRTSVETENQLICQGGKLTVTSGSVFKNVNEHRKAVDDVAERDEFTGNTQEISRKLKIEEIDTDEASNLHRQSRINNSNIHVNLEANSAQRREEQIHLADHRLVKESNFSNLQQFTESSESNQNVESTSLMHSNKIKLQPNTNLVSHSLPSPNKKHRETDLQASNLVHPHEELKADMTKSNVFVSPTETALSSQRTTEKKNASQTNSTSVVILAGGAQERQNETMRRAMQTQSSNRVPGLTKQKSSHYELAGRPSSKHLNLHYQENAQHINQEVNTINSQSLLMPPPCQLVRRGSSCVDRTNEMETEEIYIESGSNTSNRHTKAGTSALPAELVHEGRRDEVHGELLYLKTPEDALGSALRSEESSRKFVGEFIQKARHEISNETQIDTTISTIGYSNQDHSKTSPAQYGSDDVQANNCESRHPSRGAGTKGPTDEIWHEIDPSVQEMSVIEVPDHSATSGPIIARRSGRSLWSMIADIVLLRWGSQAEMPTSAAHSHEKSTANESVSSETWFSGHEHDEKDDEIIRRGRSSLQTAVTSDQLQPAQPFSITQTYSPSGDKETPPEADVLLQIKPGNSSAKTLSSGSVQDDFGWRENGQDVNNPPLVLQLGEPSLTQPKGGTISSMGKTTSVTVETDFSVSSQIEGVDGDGEKLIKVGGPEVKNLELKQRKLQRAKQVPKDRFDEWEEAYRLESEQRKIDEMFMREALMEANRAANNWEVPVGAVLVQHGKIIARGCNLVEELRDSTAHAEMICIREASNVLRSWRLAETTLYVTLEPCPMCAGAILQARVDTLVWGAPNKLLGADGSWVRLFPSGEAEAGNGSEVADKPAPPVHPFHPKMTIRRGVLASECADTMQQFFQLRRKKKEKKPEPPSQPSCLPITPNPSKLLDKMHGMFHFMFCL